MNLMNLSAVLILCLFESIYPGKRADSIFLDHHRLEGNTRYLFKKVLFTLHVVTKLLSSKAP